jgi:hypothetical protein
MHEDQGPAELGPPMQDNRVQPISWRPFYRRVIVHTFLFFLIFSAFYWPKTWTATGLGC